jgi:cobalt transporter subunit CbtB
MNTSIQSGLGQRVGQVVLSVPAQSILYSALCSLIIWTVYFSSYPPAHNTAHSLRHHSMGVSCH